MRNELGIEAARDAHRLSTTKVTVQPVDVSVRTALAKCIN